MYQTINFHVSTMECSETYTFASSPIIDDASNWIEGLLKQFNNFTLFEECSS